MDIIFLLTIIALIVSIFGIAFTWYINYKEYLLRDIRDILLCARECASWDLNSERHLFEWLENTREGELHHRNVITLLKIRKKAFDYLILHIDEDDKLPINILRKRYEIKKIK